MRFWCGRMRSEGIPFAYRFSMQRPQRARAKLRGFLRLLTLLALPRAPQAKSQAPESMDRSTISAALPEQSEEQAVAIRAAQAETAEQANPVTCTFPPTPPGAILKNTLAMFTYPVGTVLEYDCAKRYKRVPGTSNSIRCGDNGQWSTPDEFCKVSCDPPPDLRFVTLQEEFKKLSFFPPGMVVKYDCNPGHVRIHGTENSIRCTDSLTWTDPHQFCEGICPPPPKLTTVKLKKEYEGIKKFVIYTRVEYECKEGYKPLPFPGDIGSAICLENFKWTGALEFCESNVFICF